MLIKTLIFIEGIPGSLTLARFLVGNNGAGVALLLLVADATRAADDSFTLITRVANK